MMQFNKKALLLAGLFTGALLTGCQSQSNVLNFSTPSPTTTFNITRLTAVPEVGAMFQQAVQQDLNAKGFQIVQSGANANVIVNVRKFYATVEQGNILYKVNAEVNVEVAVKGAKGHFNKNFNATRGYEGAALTTDNDDIKSVLSQAYQDVVKSIYNDNEIANAIHQYK